MNLEQLRARHIPFDSLRSTTEAFIDYAIEECSPKFNYALIGSGVSQNPNQPVSLRDLHGFQLGGVSLPHGKVNPPHMHFTCEVFVCTRGDWKLMWGFNPEPEQAMIGEGDIVSVPTWIYRSFRNEGVDDGFLFSCLGRDDNGGILWGPSTVAAAQKAGVYLTSDHRMVNTLRGEALGPNERLWEPMTQEEIANLEVWTPEAMAQRVVRWKDLRWSQEALLDSALPGHGAAMAPVVGLGMSQSRSAIPPVANSHGMSIEWLRIPAGGQVDWHRLGHKQVVIAKKGDLLVKVRADDGVYEQSLHGSAQAWDAYALPDQHWRSLHNTGTETAYALLVTSGDEKKKIEWADDVVSAAASAGWTLDANYCTALKRFVDRSQR
jgi:mannose-6-phosphate isomerase-like protein (cupin superfamily)